MWNGHSNVPSFSRDPSGGLFIHGGDIFRWIDASYQKHYEHLLSCGLYDRLTQRGWIISHEEVSDPTPREGIYKVIKPLKIPFVSYPYEWCFSQLKDAALLTLDLQLEALSHGMSLKDASAYNVQFLKGKPVFIDTLSFETISPGAPWKAYGQFCRHFLAPLALMSLSDVHLGGLARNYLDGIPLDMASALLPRWSYLRPGLLAHLHLHARAERRFVNRRPHQALLKADQGGEAMSLFISHVEKTVRGLDLKLPAEGWSKYYETRSHYLGAASQGKDAFVEQALKDLRPASVWDLGANTGHFSRMAGRMGATVICFDADPACVEITYRQARKEQDSSLLPLLLDLSNPSPSLGWQLQERNSLAQRGPADMILALALVHHLALTYRIPLRHIAEGLAQFGDNLLIEFVPKDDPAASTLLHSASSDDLPDYTQSHFEEAFGAFFNVRMKTALPDSQRSLFLLQRRPRD